MATKSGQPVDMELRKAFQELQGKVSMTGHQMKVSDAQIDTLRRSKQHSLLVEKELSRLPEETRVYEGVGRMFILSPMPEVKKNLDLKMKAADNKIKTIESNKSYLERSMKDSENSLRELIVSKQQQSDKNTYGT